MKILAAVEPQMQHGAATPGAMLLCLYNDSSTIVP